MKKLLESCDKNYVMLDVRANSLEEAVPIMVDRLVEQKAIAKENSDLIVGEIRKREQLSTTAIGHSVAVPHVYLDTIANPTIAIARLEHGVNAGAPDGAPVQFIFLLLGPKTATTEHLDSLAAVARLMSDDEFHYLLMTAQSSADVRAAIVSRID